MLPPALTNSKAFSIKFLIWGSDFFTELATVESSKFISEIISEIDFTSSFE